MYIIAYMYFKKSEEFHDSDLTPQIDLLLNMLFFSLKISTLI